MRATAAAAAIRERAAAAIAADEHQRACVDAHLLAAADALAAACLDSGPAERRAGLVALFAGVIEPLNDGFARIGRRVSTRVMARVIWRCAEQDPDLAAGLAAHNLHNEAQLLARHARLRSADAPITIEPQRIAVLSRVTLGADILLTSVVIQWLHQRWPQAQIVLFGAAKLAALFAGLPALRVHPLSYERRGDLRERLHAWRSLQHAIADEDIDLLVNPDSRLDQLGLLPLIAEERTALWEHGLEAGAAVISLAAACDAWCERRFAAPGASCLPRLWPDATTERWRTALCAALGPAPLVAVKLDHGGNPAKALPRAAEVRLLAELRKRGWRIVLDRGFGAEELANSDALLAAAGLVALDVVEDPGQAGGRAWNALEPGELATAPVVRLHGSIGFWAAAVAGCRLALAYDSVGHHLAAALGVPVVVAFTGYAQPEFPVAWQPRGPASVELVCIASSEREQPRAWQALFAAIPHAPGG
ncbi:MAG: glycosyltransferase family 9 protein [Planctomycetota bacterium]